MLGHPRVQAVLHWLVGKAGSWVMRLLMCTVRVTGYPPGQRPPAPEGHKAGIFVLWHHSLLLAVYRFRDQGNLALISQHGDGEYIARIAEELGFHTVRGSSTRGGARALVELRRKAREGRHVGIATDGPRGPRQVVHVGAVFLAQVTGMPISPFISGLSDCWELPSWDRFRIPKPFSRAVARFGAPVFIPKDASAEELECYRQQLQDVMCSMQDEVDAQARLGSRTP